MTDGRRSSADDADIGVTAGPLSLPQQVEQRVIEALRSGALRPGEKIVEMALAQRLGVSRSPLREALKSLEAVSLVQTRRGRGSFVATISADQLVEMSAMRAAIEGMAARILAVEPDRGLDKLERLHARILAAFEARRLSQWRELNWQFHEAVCEAAGNPFILRSWHSISLFVRMFVNQNPAFETDPSLIMSNHEKLLAALVSGDPDRAEAVFRGLILKAAYNLVDRPLPSFAQSLVAAIGEES